MPTLAEINGLGPVEAKAFFLECCGSSRWAESMAGCRPFWNIHVVRNAAETIWEYLTPEDRRQALRAREDRDREPVPDPLAEELDLYERKFGYRFVAGPHLSGPEDILGEVRRRLEYHPGAEFDIAAGEEFRRMIQEVMERITG